MRALGDPARAGLAAAAFVAFAGAFAGVPLGARGANAPVAMTSATPAARRDSGPAVVLPRRDPFAGGLANVRANAAPAPRQPATLEPVTRIPAALVPLPPNAGAGSAPFPFGGETVRVRAVVTGTRPFALVEEAGRTRLVTLRDTVAGDTVAAIGAAGVRLTHGRTLGVAPDAPPAGLAGDPQ